MRLSDEDNIRIAEAVEMAERGTSGEIRCVLASHTDEPGAGPALIAAAAALIAPPLAILLGFDPEALAGLFGAWSIGHLAAADARIASTLAAYIGLQTVIFAGAFALASWRGLRRRLTPKAVKAARAHETALLHFEALGLSHTRDRTGVLLFASVADHHAEVLADEGIYARVPHEAWDEVVALLVDGLKRDAPADGFVAAVERTGAILSGALPPAPDDRNELPNAPVQTGARPARRRR